MHSHIIPWNEEKFRLKRIQNATLKNHDLDMCEARTLEEMAEEANKLKEASQEIIENFYNIDSSQIPR